MWVHSQNMARAKKRDFGSKVTRINRDSEFGVRDSEFGIRSSGFGVRDSGFGIRGSGFGVRGSGFGVRVGSTGFSGIMIIFCIG